MEFPWRHQTHFAENFRADDCRFEHCCAAGRDLLTGEHGGPVEVELGARVLDQRPEHLVRRPGVTQPGSRDQGVEARVGEAVDDAPLLDAHSVDLFDLTDEQLDVLQLRQRDGELVDRDRVRALEHVDADDVAAHRADA